MRPILDDLELPLVQEMTTYDRRMLAEMKPPGFDGSVLQNLGLRPGRIVLWGVSAGADADTFVSQLDQKYRDGRPVPFVADITADTDIENVVIDDVRFQDLAGKPDRFAYVLTLREYVEPTEPEELEALENDLLDEASDLMEDLTEGLDLGLSFATGLERFVGPLTGILDRLRAANA